MPGRRIRRRTALRLGWGLLALAVLRIALELLDGGGSVPFAAVSTALIAGMLLGRAQEFDLAKKDLGLRPDD